MDIRFQIRQIEKTFSQNVLLPAAYRLFCLTGRRARKADGEGGTPRKKQILLADAHHDSVPESMEPVAEELKRRADAAGKNQRFEVRELYLDYGKSGAVKTIICMLRFMKAYAGADTVVICDNFLPVASCRKVPETRVVQLWHACGAMKRFGYDSTEDIPASYKGYVYANVDLVTVSGEAAVGPFASAMRMERSHIAALGVSRSDRFFDPAYLKACRERFFHVYPRAKRKKVVLWAPTFRGNAARPSVVDLDLEKLSRMLGEEYFVVSSLHPHMRGQRAKLTTSQMLPAADILIADYSSLVYEYLLLKKPLVLFAPDLEEYRIKRGFYMDPEELPGRIVLREEELAQAVKEAVCDEAKTQAFLDKWMGACDGHATERIVDEILR